MSNSVKVCVGGKIDIRMSPIAFFLTQGGSLKGSMLSGRKNRRRSRFTLDPDEESVNLGYSLSLSTHSMVHKIQSEERQVGLRTSSWTLDIFVISQPNWLEFGLQAHFLKMFGHAKFQPSSICSFRFLLVNFSRLF